MIDLYLDSNILNGILYFKTNNFSFISIINIMYEYR